MLVVFHIKEMVCSLQLADGVTHGVGDDPRNPPRCLERVRKKFQMTNFSIPNNFSFMKHAEKSVPGIADVGVPHGYGDAPQNSTQMSEGGQQKVSYDQSYYS